MCRIAYVRGIRREQDTGRSQTQRPVFGQDDHTFSSTIPEKMPEILYRIMNM